MHFELVSELSAVETIAEGSAIRLLSLLDELYGRGRWRKLKGFAVVRLSSGRVVQAELHWYDAHGIGRRRMKIKRLMS